MAMKFNPAFQSDAEAVEGFVVRRHEYEAIVEAFTYSATSGGPAPHILVVAPRGAGKTTLCRRLVAETRCSEALASWHAILLSEESYAVTTPGEFFLECLFRLRDELPQDVQLQTAHDRAVLAQTESELEARAREGLADFAAARGGRLLIVVENFHTILCEQFQGPADGAARHLLQCLDDSLFGVLATTVRHSLDDPVDAALLEHFDRVDLKPLSLTECSDLWQALTGAEVNEARLRPLEILTGGSPRLLHILAEFMQTPSLHNLMANLNFLIDQNTEYFKSQLDGLPPMERKVFATLLDTWDPSTAKQIAETARVNTNVASAVLARLADRGAVVKEPGKGRAAIYYAAERLFNIYYLMRRRSHPSQRVRALVTFMMEYYDSDDLVDTTALLLREACTLEPSDRSDYHTTFDAIMARSNETVRTRILAKTPPEFIASFRADQRSIRLRNAAHLPRNPKADETDAAVSELLAKIEHAGDEGDLEQAMSLIREGLDNHPELSELWIRLSFAELQAGAHDKAIEAAKMATQSRPQDPWSHAALGYALRMAKQQGDAKAAFEAALVLDPGQTFALTALAQIHEQADDRQAAIALFDRANEQDALQDISAAYFGHLLAREGENERAHALLSEWARDPDNRSSRRALVDMLGEEERLAEAVTTLRDQAAGGDWRIWFDLGIVYQDRLDDEVKALDALRKAIGAGGESPSLFSRFSGAAVATGALEELRSVSEEIVSRSPEDGDIWVASGLMLDHGGDQTGAMARLRQALTLGAGYRAAVPLARILLREATGRRDAEAVLRDSLATTKGVRKCAIARELAELLIHAGDEGSANETIDRAMAANPRCSCCQVLRGDIANRRADISAATAAYRAALAVDPSDVAALTSLASLLPVAERDELIARAIEVEPEDPRVLLAKAELTDDLDRQAREVEEILALDPEFVEAHLLLVRNSIEREDVPTIKRHLAAVLDQLATRRELIPAFVAVLMGAIDIGQLDEFLRLLTEHPNAVVVEPAIVALRMVGGETPLVAKEIRDVAFDIIMRHSASASSGMISRK
jgi:tetratricopeptide (TPR) repeat protein